MTVTASGNFNMMCEVESLKSRVQLRDSRDSARAAGRRQCPARVRPGTATETVPVTPIRTLTVTQTESSGSSRPAGPAAGVASAAAGGLGLGVNLSLELVT